MSIFAWTKNRVLFLCSSVHTVYSNKNHRNQNSYAHITSVNLESMGDLPPITTVEVSTIFNCHMMEQLTPQKINIKLLLKIYLLAWNEIYT